MENIQKKAEELDDSPKPINQEEVKAQIIQKFGLDEDENSELIDKLLIDRVAELNRFSTLIAQKRNYRTKLEELSNVKLPDSVAPVTVAAPKEVVLDESKIIEVLEKRDLDALSLSENLKKEVSTYAKLQNITVKKAMDSDYITFLKEKEEKAQKIEDASLGNAPRKPVHKDYGNMKASDFNLKTPEGLSDFKKYEEDLRKKLG